MSIFLHTFRHSFACNAILHGEPLTVVRDWLGHSHLMRNMVYLGSALYAVTVGSVIDLDDGKRFPVTTCLTLDVNSGKYSNAENSEVIVYFLKSHQGGDTIFF